VEVLYVLTVNVNANTFIYLFICCITKLVVVTTCVQWCQVLPHLAEMECLLLQMTATDSETETNSVQGVRNFHIMLYASA